MHTQDGAYPWRCTNKAHYNHRKSQVIETEVRGLASVSSVASWCVARAGSCMWDRARVGGAHITWCIHKVVQTQGTAHTRQFVATAGLMLLKGGVAADLRIEGSELWR